MNKDSIKKLTKLEELRINNNLTHKQMADILKISKAYYWQIENGNRNLYYKLAIKIASCVTKPTSPTVPTDEV